nr:exocyst complex component SEC10 [Tanacetum cinerariifolium]
MIQVKEMMQDKDLKNSIAGGAVYTGLQECIETVMADVEQLLSAEQKDADYKSPKSRPTSACTRVVTYLTRVRKASFTELGAFLTELGNCLHKGLSNHWQKYTVSQSGGSRFELEITTYRNFMRSFNAPTVDEKFESLSSELFTTAPESLWSLLEGTPSILEDAQRFIQLRDDYKSAGLADKLSSLWPSS